jgi:RNase P subunit RPR2
MEENKNDKKQKNTPILNESILRISFLEQAASLLTSQNHLAMPTNDLLGRLLLRELREISYVDQLRIHRDLKRSFCKK